MLGKTSFQMWFLVCQLDEFFITPVGKGRGGGEKGATSILASKLRAIKEYL